METWICLRVGSDRLEFTRQYQEVTDPGQLTWKPGLCRYLFNGVEIDKAQADEILRGWQNSNCEIELVE